MEHGRLTDGWASWALITAAAVPAAATARLGWLVLGGSVDDAFGSQDPPATGADLLGVRWSNLWTYPSVPVLLLAGSLLVGVLATVVVSGRPGPLVPVRSARTAATVVAGATALLGLAGAAGFAAQLAGVLPVNQWSSPTGLKLDAFTPGFAAVLATSVLGIAAVCVLARREHDGPDAEPDRDPELVDAPEPAETAAVQEQPAGARDTGSGTRPEQALVPGFPTTPDTDLDLYRRP